MATLRYEVISDTCVFVTLRLDDSKAASGMLSPTEAKRFAWALLADLAPDEVFPAELLAQPVARAPRRGYGPHGLMRQRISGALADLGSATAEQIATKIKTSRGRVAQTAKLMLSEGSLAKTGAFWRLAS